MIRSSCRSLCALAALAALAACAPSEEGKIPCSDTSNCPSDFPTCSTSGFCVTFQPATRLVAVSGDSQAAAVAGSPLPAALVVSAQDANGNGVPGIAVTWAVTAGAGTITATSTTGADGTASVTPSLGNTVATNTFTATAAGLTPGTVTFNELSIAGPTASFLVSFPSSIGVQLPGTATVTAKDKNGNLSSYTGTVAVTLGKADALATLPGAFALTITSTTPGTIPGIIFGKAATGQTVIVTDTTTASITGTSNAFNVASGTTTTAVTSNHNPSKFGESVTFTATVTPGTTGPVLPSGTVTFFSDGVGIGTGTLVGGQATASTSALAVGTHAITAQYAGDSSFAGSTSLPITQTVNQAATTVTLASDTNPSVFGQTVTLTATIHVTSPGAGTPTGNVAFLDGATGIATCATQALTGTTATCVISTLSVGTHQVTAVYGADLSFSGSTSAAVAQKVNQAATTTTLGGPTTAVSGQSLIYTATVTVNTPGAGTASASNVTFKDGTTTIGCTPAVTTNVATCTTSFLVGTHNVTAVYAGETNFAGSTSTAVSTVVSAAATTTTLAATPATSSVSGQSVSFVATVTANTPGGGTPAASHVTFKDGVGNVACTPTVAANVATCTLTTLAIGTHSITAVYAGETQFTGSASTPAIAFTVGKAATTTTLTAPTTAVVGETVTFSATVAVNAPGAGAPNGGNVTFDVDAAPITCATTGATGSTATCTISFPTAGTHSITAVYAGETSFTGSTSTATTLTIGPATTTSALSVPAGALVTGQSVTLSATVSVSSPGTGAPPGNLISFLDGATTIVCTAQTTGTSSATCTTSFTAVGSPHSVTAAFAGNANFSSSVSTANPVTVGKASTTTVATTSPGTSVFGQSVTINATITTTPAGGSPTGSVAFKDGATIIAGCGTQPVASNAASCTTTALTVGTHNITAVYSGDGNFLTSTSGIATEGVAKASTATTVSSDANPAVFGQTVTFSAAVAPVSPGGGVPTGAVTFSDNGGPLAGCATPQTLSSGTATCVTNGLSVATHPITAVYNGDGNFNASPTSPTFNELVTQALPTVTITASQPGGTGTNVQFGILVTGSTTAPSGTVNVAKQATPATTIASCTLSASGNAGSCSTSASVAAGTTVFVANYVGDANYTPASGTSNSLQVNVAPPPGTAVVINGGPSDGKVFIVKGSGVSTSIFDPATSAQTAGPALTVSRSFTTATAIGGGQILIAGGNGKGGSTFELCTASACSPVGMIVAQRCNAAAALVGTHVLVAGGDDCAGSALASWDLWSADAVTSSTAANQLSEARASPTATVVADGTVLIAGGGSAAAELFKLADLSVTKLPSMLAARSGHTSTLLPAGSKACASGSCVFLAGGVSSGPTWEAFDLARNSFGRPANAMELLNPLRAQQAAALLADGRVLIAGGVAGNQAIETSETFDGARFAPGPALQTARTGAASAYVPALGLLMLAAGNAAPELLAAP
jgi:large repetitive protein